MNASPTAPRAPSLDVLLIHHPSANRHRPIPIPAVGLVSLADTLDRNGIRAQALNLWVEEAVEPGFDAVAYAVATGARVVGLSINWFFQLPDSLALARRFAAEQPDILVVAGGFCASYLAGDLIAEHPELDVVVRGDGELPLLRLCQQVLAHPGRAWDSVPNLVFRDDAGMVRETPFTHVLDEAQFAALRPTRLELLKNRAAAARLTARLAPQKFADRFDFAGKSVLCLAPTRGCDHLCPLCGGNRHAQLRAFHRQRPLYQPREAFLRDVRDALAQGFGNLYLCSDPEPNGRYYFDLFEGIRREGLGLNLLFECWSLPSVAFVEEVRRTFGQALLILSPDSADEEVRRRTKGPLTFGNDELRDRLRFIWSADLCTQVFFGFFLPGDDAGTVRATLRMRHELENPQSEAPYLAFSTDPGSPVQLDPAGHGMHTDLRTLGDYLAALPRDRASSNLIAHRPSAMSAAEAQRLALHVEVDQLLGKLLPLSLLLLRTLPATSPHGTREEELLDGLVADVTAHGGIPGATRLIDGTLGCVSKWNIPTELGIRLTDLVRFEGAPYRLMDASFGTVGRHYTSLCCEVPGVDRDALLARSDTASAEERFEIDVLGLVHALRSGEPPAIVRRSLLVRWVLEPGGSYAVLTSG